MWLNLIKQADMKFIWINYASNLHVILFIYSQTIEAYMYQLYETHIYICMHVIVTFNWYQLNVTHNLNDYCTYIGSCPDDYFVQWCILLMCGNVNHLQIQGQI